MSAKPYHAGHDALVRMACEECDEVVVFVSTADRARKGEYPVAASVMRKLWDETILASLPENAYVQFVPNPVGAVYQLIGDRNTDASSEETLVVYSDPADMDRNFPERSLAKYGQRLVEKRLLARRHVRRDSTVNVSGTEMRAWLQHGDKAKFVAHLPESLDREVIWKALTKR